MYFGRLTALAGLLFVAFAAFSAMAVSAYASETALGCKDVEYKKTDFTVCKFSAQSSIVRTYLNDDNDTPYGNFTALTKSLADQNQMLVFAMNGGMYKTDRSAAGLYVEGWEQGQALNTNKGSGNFHMIPNGVFLIWQEDGFRGAHVMTTEDYKNKMAHDVVKKDVVKYATQSGPMLVIDGKLHAKFNQDSLSKYIRNGVGVSGDDIYFAISNEVVNFHTFASLFKDYLGATNALYLDGAISKLYAPELNRNDYGLPMGPMIAVVEAAE